MVIGEHATNTAVATRTIRDVVARHVPTTWDSQTTTRAVAESAMWAVAVVESASEAETATKLWSVVVPVAAAAVPAAAAAAAVVALDDSAAERLGIETVVAKPPSSPVPEAKAAVVAVAVAVIAQMRIHVPIPIQIQFSNSNPILTGEAVVEEEATDGLSSSSSSLSFAPSTS
jgi:hypothetical protein